jgi:hypothetical protein
MRLAASGLFALGVFAWAVPRLSDASPRTADGIALISADDFPGGLVAERSIASLSADDFGHPLRVPKDRVTTDRDSTDAGVNADTSSGAGDASQSDKLSNLTELDPVSRSNIVKFTRTSAFSGFSKTDQAFVANYVYEYPDEASATEALLVLKKSLSATSSVGSEKIAVMSESGNSGIFQLSKSDGEAVSWTVRRNGSQIVMLMVNGFDQKRVTRATERLNNLLDQRER